MSSMDKNTMNIVLNDARGTTDKAHILAETEKRQMERSREYRRRYIERKKEKDAVMQQRIEEIQKELQQAQLEKADLITQSQALGSLLCHSKSIVEALSTAASASAAMARSLGSQAIEGVNSIHNWTHHRWDMMPTVAEVLAGTAWTPSDDQMRWFSSGLNSKEFFANNLMFINRITYVLEEGKASPEAQKKSELKVDYAITNWIRFITFLHNERPEVMQEIVCIHLLKALRDQAAAGKYVCPQMLQNGPGQLAECVELSPEQVVKLEEVWRQFVRDIKAARLFLGTYTSKVADDVEAVMETGVYTPNSGVHAAQSFLFALDSANASDEFLLKEGQAFTRLWTGTVQVLTSMQTAIVLTSCRPLVPHLPDICGMLLNSNNGPDGNKQELIPT